MMVTRRYRFSAAHRLHSPALDEEANRAAYGKCNNPFGHGHNYVLEVTLAGPVNECTGRVVDPERLDELVHGAVLAGWSHRNLNAEDSELADCPPSSENLLGSAWRRLERAVREAFPAGPRLVRLRLEETRRNSFEMMEEDER
ncbi:MAG: 6-carboxytetrahydropterin synthase [Bryobacterales bacterium]|nr:6-carboxytetrahydropterin synthase [Bryobacterales bacterium]